MEYMIRIFPANGVKLFNKYSRRCFQLPRYCSTETSESKKQKKPHPYRNIHPWKSLTQFSNSLVAGVIHNEDGLVAVNKPYGISGRNREIKIDKPTRIVNDVNYSLEDAVPHIASALGYQSLQLIKTPEKFASGIALLSANETVQNAVEKSLRRAEGMRILSKTYWVVTTKLPNMMEGEMRLAIRQQPEPGGTFTQPVIITSWTKKEQKTREIKILNVQFKVISNAIDNISSLVQIRSSTVRWHALRLLAATVLYSPILGDEKYGSRIKNVLGKWVNVSPFVDAAKEPPKLDKHFLKKLDLQQGKESLIPTHIHLREMYLPMYKKKDRTLILTAPPMPEFTWTCKQLRFKHDLFTNEKTNQTNDKECEDKEFARHQAVT
ncbi:mitochondrial RNA pseudouridine synthase RPUSD4-like [Venturia canescens]|uniref:mitochondrial RNA pseudouridine synthase RPUSD4-like n=1 Tax=Venturia canescens TaxID=32260 RepID=UPI001C9D037B|nr:mitochondrial RNA pseudouridine synthase RPUSD4-like [Venturia canescens]